MLQQIPVFSILCRSAIGLLEQRQILDCGGVESPRFDICVTFWGDLRRFPYPNVKSGVDLGATYGRRAVVGQVQPHSHILEREVPLLAGSCLEPCDDDLGAVA